MTFLQSSRASKRKRGVLKRELGIIGPGRIVSTTHAKRTFSTRKQTVRLGELFPYRSNSLTVGIPLSGSFPYKYYPGWSPVRIYFKGKAQESVFSLRHTGKVQAFKQGHVIE